MALRILFLLGFLFGCLFARTSQIAMAPVSGSVWFRGPFETGTDFPFVFSAFLFDSLFYALPLFKSISALPFMVWQNSVSAVFESMPCCTA